MLIVDDHPATRMGLRSYIQVVHPDWKILEVANGKAAITQIENQHVSVVILDYQVPHVDGLGVTQYVARRSKKPPILLYTFLDSLVVARHFLRLGGKGFFTKRKIWMSYGGHSGLDER